MIKFVTLLTTLKIKIPSFMNNNVKNALIVTSIAVAAFLVYKFVIAKDMDDQKESQNNSGNENTVADTEEKTQPGEQVTVNASNLV